MKPYSLVKIIPYFGEWPEWIHFYMASCKANPDIDWLIYTDCGNIAGLPDNVKLVETTFNDYKRLVSDKLGIHFNPKHAYKLCDLKPALGYIHYEDIQDHDYFAFGDIDVIYGNIRKFYTDDLLSRHHMISTHHDRVSGHFATFKNTPLMREAFKQIPYWEAALSLPQHLGIDESKFSKVFLRHKKHPHWMRRLMGITSPYRRNVLFKEQYSTILSPKPWHNGQKDHPTEWRWQNGKLTNTQDGDREFMYLHFMNFKSNTYLPGEEPSAWMQQDNIIHMDGTRAFEEGFKITPRGFEPL